MKIFRFLFFQSLAFTFLLSFLLLLLYVLVRLSNYLDDVLQGGIGVAAVFPILFWRLPDFLSYIFPLGFFLGLLLTLWRLRMEGEMAGILGVGVTPKRFLMYLLVPALFIGVLTGLNSLYLGPKGMKMASKVIAEGERENFLRQIAAGNFYRIGNLIVHAEDIQRTKGDEHMMRNIIVAEKKAGAPMPRLSTAEEGHVSLTQDGRLLVNLRNGHNYETNSRGGFDVFSFGSLNHYLGGDGKKRGNLFSWRSRSSTELWSSKNALAQAHWYWRVSLALAAPMILLVVLGGVGCLLSATGRIRRISLLKGFAFGFFYFLSLLFINEQTLALRINSLLAYVCVHLFFALIGFIFYWRANECLR